MTVQPTRRPHVVVVGGGCGGLEVARSLGACPVDVTVIDRRPCQVLYPLLHQVAGGRIRVDDLSAPIARRLRADNAHSLTAEVSRIDLAHRAICLTTGSRLAYDYLVVAAGSEPRYAEPAGRWRELAPALEDADSAARIHARLRSAVERAGAGGLRGHPVHCVVIGAGPTGVELAAALAATAPRRAGRRHARSQSPRVTLLEQADRVLPLHSHCDGRRAHSALERAGVGIRTHTRARAVEPTAVICDGGRMQTDVICWAGGVRPATLARHIDADHDPFDRVVVGGDCSLPCHPEVFVIGDMSRPMPHPRDAPLPATASVALQQGRSVARNIVRDLRRVPRHAVAFQNRADLMAVPPGATIHHHGGCASSLRSLVDGCRRAGLGRGARVLARTLLRGVTGGELLAPQQTPTTD